MKAWFQRVARWIHGRTAWAAGPAAPETLCCRMAATVRWMPEAVLHNNRRDPDCIRLGEHTVIRGELLTFGHGGDIQIGHHGYVGAGTRIWSARSIRIGDRVLISHNVNIFDNDTHPLDDPQARHRHYQAILTTGHPEALDLNERPVVIEDDVLIGCQSILLPGVTIGARAVVGAGSVVTRDVAADTVVAGNPARFIRTLARKAAS